MKRTLSNTLIDSIISILSEDDRILFAFLYGSAAKSGYGNDIDIAMYAAPESDFYRLSADLEVSLHKKTDIPPDVFDVRILNGLEERGDIFGLLYLKNVLSDSRLLVDRDPDTRADFLECYGTRFRECEGLIQEVMI